MVPVVDSNNIPLMPCTEKRARLLMNRKAAKPYWQKGIFCIKLLREPSARNYQPVVLGIDPGSKREGYTVATEKAVVLNITTNTPFWVTEKMKTRRNLRKNRRGRKTPFRLKRVNRASFKSVGKTNPSSKTRWQAKLRIINLIKRILPLSIIALEDIVSRKIKGKRKWNQTFSALESGKNIFQNQIKQMKMKIVLIKGNQTKIHRENRSFIKNKDKLKFQWNAHNVDSHCLAEIALKTEIKPYLGLYQINFFNFKRRQLHVQNPIKGGFRRRNGGTVSMGKGRGAVVKYENKFYYLGGFSKQGLSLHSVLSGKRVKRAISLHNIDMKYNLSWRVQLLPAINLWKLIPDFG